MLEFGTVSELIKTLVFKSVDLWSLEFSREKIFFNIIENVRVCTECGCQGKNESWRKYSDIRMSEKAWVDSSSGSKVQESRSL